MSVEAILKNNKIIKTKKTITIMKFLNRSILALAGIIMAGCSSSDDNITNNPPQPASESNKVETLTASIKMYVTDNNVVPISESYRSLGYAVRLIRNVR